ncbi:nucleotide-diphospho-sugar transferase [Aspergillus coremiiformis]|uniref:Translation initiation factor eIF2B subunit gamma n=1 Tax=Aspergillus coremiiformis TaxID=138285 RepID=A0A5N6ZDF0_9EURO|nr:nucleotide-diphospho-sugar transferase [Aspergillus coremiiformis]
MPHSIPVPATGFQALILCGPGVSLNTFTSNPEEYPKCLIPVANRPMVYYPLDFCKRSGITDITLITPPSALAPLQAALQQNPYLTSLPSPSPTVLAPKDLQMTTPTAELLRLPEVQACIKTDFLLLPCDLICEIPGESLLEAWMVSLSDIREGRNAQGGPNSLGPGGEKSGRRGGLAVFYPTQGAEDSVKGEVTDFVAVAPLQQDEEPAVSRYGLSKLVMSMPMDTVKEKLEHDKGFLIRHSLVEKHAQVKMLTTYRDAGLYVLPYWVRDLARQQERLESVSEDLIGYWAKAQWQRGLGEKLGLDSILGRENESLDENGSYDGESLEEEINLRDMSTTTYSSPAQHVSKSSDQVRNAESTADVQQSIEVPPILAYIQRGSAPFVRRVDSTAVLLSTSLRLAKLECIEEVGRAAASPFAFPSKIAYPEGVAQRTIVTKADCLLGPNVTVEEKCVIKESCIGTNTKICSGARLTRCVVLDGAVIGERCVLTGCIIGRRSKVGRESVLKDCEVQDGNVVPDETDAKNEQFMIFEGIDEEDDADMDVSDNVADNQDDLSL